VIESEFPEDLALVEIGGEVVMQSNSGSNRELEDLVIADGEEVLSPDDIMKET